MAAFQTPVLQLQNALKQNGFGWHLQHHFEEIARVSLSNGVPVRQAHLETLGASCSTWASIRSDGTCYFCLLRVASHTLDCHHRICSSCVVTCGMPSEPWRYQLPRCPFCHQPNQAVFPLQPPTTGSRVLHLGGSCPENTLRFLNDLQHEIGLTTMPLREYFDGVIASDFGKNPVVLPCDLSAENPQAPSLSSPCFLSIGHKLIANTICPGCGARSVEGKDRSASGQAWNGISTKLGT